MGAIQGSGRISQPLKPGEYLILSLKRSRGQTQAATFPSYSLEGEIFEKKIDALFLNPSKEFKIRGFKASVRYCRWRRRTGCALRRDFRGDA